MLNMYQSSETYNEWALRRFEILLLMDLLMKIHTGDPT